MSKGCKVYCRHFVNKLNICTLFQIVFCVILFGTAFVTLTPVAMKVCQGQDLPIITVLIKLHMVYESINTQHIRLH